MLYVVANETAVGPGNPPADALYVWCCVHVCGKVSVRVSEWLCVRLSVCVHVCACAHVCVCGLQTPLLAQDPLAVSAWCLRVCGVCCVCTFVCFRVCASVCELMRATTCCVIVRVCVCVALPATKASSSTH
jgi:hypothetical protein